MLKFRRSAFKHGITSERIEQVLSDKYGSTIWFELQPDRQGNLQEMIVGYDNNGILLEIGLTYLGESIFVFHAARVSFVWRVRHREES